MTVSIVSLAARGEDEIAVCFEIRSGEHLQKQSFTVSAAAVADLRLQTGACDRELYDAVAHESSIFSAVKKGLYLLGFGRCSEKALCRKLMAKGIDREIATEAVGELSRRGYLNAENDAKREAERQAAKLWGRRRIAAALFEKGYEQTAIVGALDALEDEGIDYIELCSERLRRTLRELPCEPDAKRKLIASLERCGFSRDEIREAWKIICRENSEKN